MNAKCLFSTLILVLLFSSSFSATCYRTESFCSNYDTVEYNCRNENYNPHSCRVYGLYTKYVKKTCTSTTDYITEKSCNFEWQYKCDYIKKEVPCKYYSKEPCYECNPYNCRWEEKMVCKDIKIYKTYDCSYFETLTGWHDGTCYDSRMVCDTATDYDKCLTWQDKEVSYECSNMKLENYNFSATTSKVGEKILTMFSLTDCSGRINYEFYMKNMKTVGSAKCGLNLVEIEPNTVGTQTILLKLKDDATSITKSLGTILVINPNSQTDSNNPFIATAFINNIESGKYDDKIIEWINQGLSNEEIIKNLMMTFGAVGLAITVSQANNIKEHVKILRNKKLNNSNIYGINFELFIKPDEKIFKTNKELTIIQYKYNDENADYFSKKMGWNKELTYTMVFDKNGNLVGAGTPDKLKMTYLDPAVENNSGTLQERVATFKVDDKTYSFTPSLIITNNYDSANKLNSHYWSNMQRVQGIFDPDKKYEEQKPSNFSLLTNFVFNFISLVGMFYSSAQQAKQNTQNYFSQLKYLSNSLNLINLGDGISVDANGEICLDPIKALNNRQLLESLSVGLTYYPQLYTNEELLNIISSGYESIYELNLRIANNYLNNLNLKTINPSITLSFYGKSGYKQNNINWNYKNSESDLMHEIGHCISEEIFNEKSNNGNYNFDWDARADVISYKIYGDNYKIMAANELELDYAYINTNNKIKLDKLIYDYFLAEKFQASEYVLENIKELLIKGGSNINNNYAQSKIIGFESEWNMQEYLMRNDK